MVRYAITDGSAGTAQGAARLLDEADRWAAEDIDFVQLREQSLEAGALLALATSMTARLHAGRTKLLVNGRPDIAVAAGGDGVHLTARPGELSPSQVRQVFGAAGAGIPVVSISCHSIAEVGRAAEGDADLILFGPVFEKRAGERLITGGVGLEQLRSACTAAGPVPVLALGGVTQANAPMCLEAGAAGVAAIRMFGGCMPMP